MCVFVPIFNPCDHSCIFVFLCIVFLAVCFLYLCPHSKLETKKWQEVSSVSSWLKGAQHTFIHFPKFSSKLNLICWAGFLCLQFFKQLVEEELAFCGIEWKKKYSQVGNFLCSSIVEFPLSSHQPSECTNTDYPGICVVSEYVENINVGVNWRSKWKNMSKRVRVFQKGRQIATNPISSKTEMHFKPAASISNLTYSIKCIQLDQTKQIQDPSFSHLMQNNMIYSSHFESLTVCAKKVIEWIGMWLISGTHARAIFPNWS